jgi:hypothetical protein
LQSGLEKEYGGSENGLGGYIKDYFLPDATYNAIMNLYEKCGLTGQKKAIEEMPFTGQPLMYMLGNRNSANGVKSVKVEHSQQGLTFTPNAKTGNYPLDNVRQLAQFSNLDDITLPISSNSQITRNDLVHLFKNARNLKEVTFIQNATVGTSITEEDVRMALQIANRDDITLVWLAP